LTDVRSLRDGQRRTVTDWFLQACVDAGYERHERTALDPDILNYLPGDHHGDRPAGLAPANGDQ
jgi:hypothetical protein